MSFASRPIFPFRPANNSSTGAARGAGGGHAQTPSVVSSIGGMSTTSSQRRRNFDADGLPIFGSPNELPNPPSHYFPSRPAKERQQQINSRRWIESQPSNSGTINSRISPRHEKDRPELPMSAGVGGSSSSPGPEAATTPVGAPTPAADEDGEGDEDAEMEDAMDLDEDEDDSRSVTSNKRASSTKPSGGGAGRGGGRAESIVDPDDEPAKKRSRTLTTAHQTAVLNALLAKVSPLPFHLPPVPGSDSANEGGGGTNDIHPSAVSQTRFPSTETREEVGQQIGMSARRVQIWFQNRRQSQKRARDREITDGPPGGGGGGHYSTPSHPYAHHPYSHSPHSSYGGGERGSPSKGPSNYYPTHPQSYQPYPDHPYAHQVHPADYLSHDPYARGAQHQQQVGSSRPMVSRQGSFDSIASVGSFSSAKTSQSARDRDGRGSFDAQGGKPRVYAFPPPPTIFPSRPNPMRVQREQEHAAAASQGAAGDSVRLPSLSAVLGGGQAPPDEREREHLQRQREPSPTSDVFAHRPPPLPTPQSHPSTNSSGSTLRAGAEHPFQLPSTDFDFARLRISPFSPPLSSRPLPPPAQSRAPERREREYSMDDSSDTEDRADPDILDMAMETMYRAPRVEPARSRLPVAPRFPTTFPTFNSSSGAGGRGANGGVGVGGGTRSEADNALRAPIGRTVGAGGSGGSGIKLPPISSMTNPGAGGPSFGVGALRTAEGSASAASETGSASSGRTFVLGRKQSFATTAEEEREERDREQSGNSGTIASGLTATGGRNNSISSTSSSGTGANPTQQSSAFFFNNNSTTSSSHNAPSISTSSTSSMSAPSPKAYPPRSLSSFSHSSPQNPSSQLPRTSIASFETSTTTSTGSSNLSSLLSGSAGGSISGTSYQGSAFRFGESGLGGSGAPGVGDSSRTSFSSEVQEEWNQLGLGRK